MNKPQVYSSFVTIVVAILIVLLLMFIYMPFNKEEEEEGIMISFGDGIEGLGEMPPPIATITPPSPTTPTPPALQEELMTQDIEETVDLEAQEKELERKRHEQIVAEQKRQEELERQRIIEAEQKRIEEEQAEKTAKANQMAGVFGQQISGVGQSAGSGTAGNPAGKGSSGGNSWSLNGRDLKGSLHKPSYNSNEEGKVVVSIRVNENGDVVAVSIASGTTISDSNLRNAAINAAKKTKFSSGNNIAIGTITYNFKLN